MNLVLYTYGKYVTHLKLGFECNTPFERNNLLANAIERIKSEVKVDEMDNWELFIQIKSKMQ